jgi:hypothetical protein
MTKKDLSKLPRLVVMMFFLLVGTGALAGDVPPVRTHAPDVPFFLESMRFQTVEMHIFPAEYSGMVMDLYSDLIWNPAFILRHDQKSVYLDYSRHLNTSTSSNSVLPPYDQYYRNSGDSFILPRWYSLSPISSVETTPLYHFAAVIPISSRFTIGLVNRSIIDYGPFRSISQYYYWDYGLLDPAQKPERLDIDENQQKVLGVQTEMTLGYKLSRKLDLGLRFGHYTYGRDGDLLDSQAGTYPHHSFDNLDDESLLIDGDQVEVGLGLVYHLGKKTQLGLFGGFCRGDSTEETASKDVTDIWREWDTNPLYYNMYRYSLEGQESFSGDGSRPYFHLTFEQDLSKKLKFRSFLSYTWSTMDIAGSILTADSFSSDHTFDYYNGNTFHRRREESQGSGQYELNGSGERSCRQWKWLASFLYVPARTWTLFGGVQVQYNSLQQDITETTHYREDNQTTYSIYLPETAQYHHSYTKNYTHKVNHDQWAIFLPVGTRLNIKKRLYVILAADLTLTFTDQLIEGELLYPSKITRKWENGQMVLNDEETDRYEEYRSAPATDLNRSWGHRFGVVYEHPCGLKLFLRTDGDIFQTSNWAVGFQYNW